MFQSGIDMVNLDVSYVSSISWYFLALFGLRSYIGYFAGEEASNAINMATVASAPMPTTNPGMPGQHISQVFAQEKDHLLMKKHEWLLANAEARLIRKLSGKDDSVNQLLEKKNN